MTITIEKALARQDSAKILERHRESVAECYECGDYDAKSVNGSLFHSLRLLAWEIREQLIDLEFSVNDLANDSATLDWRINPIEVKAVYRFNGKVIIDFDQHGRKAHIETTGWDRKRRPTAEEALELIKHAVLKGTREEFGYFTPTDAPESPERPPEQEIKEVEAHLAQSPSNPAQDGQAVNDPIATPAEIGNIRPEVENFCLSSSLSRAIAIGILVTNALQPGSGCITSEEDIFNGVWEMLEHLRRIEHVMLYDQERLIRSLPSGVSTKHYVAKVG